MIEEMIVKGSVEPVDIEGTEKILNQMRHSICKLKINGVNGTGFFCKIPFEDDTKNFLVTNHHVLSKKYYKENTKLKLVLYDDQVLSFNLKIKRKTYFNEDYDIALIELNNEDNINADNFLELDNNLFNQDNEVLYENISIYVLHFPNGDKASVSYGLMAQINDFEIKHRCSTEKGSSGSPILNLKTNKVIGIHKGYSNISKEFQFNLGIFLKCPLNDFFENELNEEIDNEEEEIDNSISQFSIEFPEISYIPNPQYSNNSIPKYIEEKANYYNDSEAKIKKKKMNFIFKDSNGNQNTLRLNLNTTIDEMLKIYLIKINKTILIGSQKKPRFFYNSAELHFGDDSLIQNYFKTNNIFITVI